MIPTEPITIEVLDDTVGCQRGDVVSVGSRDPVPEFKRYLVVGIYCGRPATLGPGPTFRQGTTCIDLVEADSEDAPVQLFTPGNILSGAPS